MVGDDQQEQEDAQHIREDGQLYVGNHSEQKGRNEFCLVFEEKLHVISLHRRPVEELWAKHTSPTHETSPTYVSTIKQQMGGGRFLLTIAYKPSIGPYT